MGRRSAFTLIEVLVVVAIIALLISILLPSLSRARAETRSVVCRSNMRQLMYGQLLYVQDYRRLPATISTFYEAGCSIAALSEAEVENRPHMFTWEGACRVSSSHRPKFIPRKGTIFRYLKNTSLYLCPDDKPGASVDQPQGGGGNGFLSYSMNAYLGWKKPEFKSFVYLVTETVRDPNGNFKTFRPGQTVMFPPATTLVLAEEHPYFHLNRRTDTGAPGSGWGEGNFNVIDKITTRHGLALGTTGKGRTNIAYLDGHAETRIYPWSTSADELFAEIGEPSVSAQNRRAFSAGCTSAECPK